MVLQTKTRVHDRLVPKNSVGQVSIVFGSNRKPAKDSAVRSAATLLAMATSALRPGEASVALISPKFSGYLKLSAIWTSCKK